MQTAFRQPALSLTATIVTRQGRVVVEFPRATVERDMYNQVDAIVFNPETPVQQEQTSFSQVTPTFGYFFGRTSFR